MSTEEYEAEMDRRGENYFNSKGDYIENNPPEEESDLATAVAAPFIFGWLLIKLAFCIGLIAASIMGLMWIFGGFG
jgi:hypothetical protein